MRSVVAKIKAADADIGSNAEMDYRIVDSDGPGVFNVSTDEDTQDGIITLLKVGAAPGPWRCLRTAGTELWHAAAVRAEVPNGSASTRRPNPADNPPHSHFQRRLG